MTTIRAQVSLESMTGLPEDASMNVWHFNSTGTLLTNANDILATLEDVYNAWSIIYSANTITGTAQVKMWDLGEDPPRVPILEGNFLITDMGDGDGLPTECAIVMSFQAEPASGVNMRRRRGRLYLGPLDLSIATTGAGVVQVNSTGIDAINAGALIMLGAGESAPWTWSVFSPTSAGVPPWDPTSLSVATSFVTNGWIDNAFDTQRRRGTEASVRSTFP